MYFRKTAVKAQIFTESKRLKIVLVVLQGDIGSKTYHLWLYILVVCSPTYYFFLIFTVMSIHPKCFQINMFFVVFILFRVFVVLFLLKVILFMYFILCTFLPSFSFNFFHTLSIFLYLHTLFSHFSYLSLCSLNFHILTPVLSYLFIMFFQLLSFIWNCNPTHAVHGDWLVLRAHPKYNVYTVDLVILPMILI